MNTFENNEFTGQPGNGTPTSDQPNPPVQETSVPAAPIRPNIPAPDASAPSAASFQSQAPAGSGAPQGRKESPFANSPYYMNTPPQIPYQYQPQTQPPVKVKTEKRSSGVGMRILAAFLTLVLVVSGCLVTALTMNFIWERRLLETEEAFNARIAALGGQTALAGSAASPESPAVIITPPPADGSAMTPSVLYANCVDSVVAISSTIGTTGYYGVMEGSSSGSGFILTEDGYVVTNYHVVENATAIDVILHDGTEYPAELVGYDSSNDLAVLKLKEEVTGLKAAALGSSSALNIGDMVVAIGNPLGELASTQTVGYVSGINREVTTDNTIINMIQTDAAINPGNSGGPLFNMYGQVIGITTAKYSGTTGSGASIEGIGFAIPMDDISGMISDLIEFGYVTGAYLGVTVQDMDPDSADLYGLPVGAYVVSVLEEGAADRAGVQPKDIIIGLGDHEVGSINELTRALRNFKAGDTTTILVIRSGKEVTLDITLDEKPQDTASAPQGGAQMPEDGNYDEWFDYFFGE